jgi:chemotaxis protein histidine kinase CheA
MNKIYEYEVKAGLKEALEKDTSVAFTCDINLEPKFQYDVEKALAKLSGNPNQSDLFYIESILVSTNWNGNDDVFSKAEVWPARSTAIDKQFNYMHNEKDIIGHMTSAHIIGSDGNEVDMSLSLEQAPDFFDIVVGSVIYKKWSDPELQSRMNQIIADIQAGKKFVSMEAHFKDFDYAAIAEDNSMLVISRNEKTSFMTKHLRAYGGNGSYEGYRVGRLLKNITFSGKGLVDNPANKRSHITSYSFNGTKASLQEDFRSQAMENTVSKAELDATKAILDNAKAELEKVKADLDKVKAEKQTVEAELVNEKALSGQKSEKIQALETSVAKYGEDMKKKEEDEKKMKAELLKRDRVAALLGAGVDSAKASEVAEKFAQASEEMFKEVVALHSVVKTEASKTDEEKETAMEKEEEEKAKKAKAELEKSKEEETKATVVLPTGETDEVLFTSASQWMSKTLGIKE